MTDDDVNALIQTAIEIETGAIYLPLPKKSVPSIRSGVVTTNIVVDEDVQRALSQQIEGRETEEFLREMLGSRSFGDYGTGREQTLGSMAAPVDSAGGGIYDSIAGIVEFAGNVFSAVADDRSDELLRGLGDSGNYVLGQLYLHEQDLKRAWEATGSTGRAILVSHTIFFCLTDLAIPAPTKGVSAVKGVVRVSGKAAITITKTAAGAWKIVRLVPGAATRAALRSVTAARVGMASIRLQGMKLGQAATREARNILDDFDNLLNPANEVAVDGIGRVDGRLLMDGADETVPTGPSPSGAGAAQVDDAARAGEAGASNGETVANAADEAQPTNANGNEGDGASAGEQTQPAVRARTEPITGPPDPLALTKTFVDEPHRFKLIVDNVLDRCAPVSGNRVMSFTTRLGKACRAPENRWITKDLGVWTHELLTKIRLGQKVAPEEMVAYTIRAAPNELELWGHALDHLAGFYKKHMFKHNSRRWYHAIFGEPAPTPRNAFLRIEELIDGPHNMPGALDGPAIANTFAERWIWRREFVRVLHQETGVHLVDDVLVDLAAWPNYGGVRTPHPLNLRAHAFWHSDRLGRAIDIHRKMDEVLDALDTRLGRPATRGEQIDAVAQMLTTEYPVVYNQWFQRGVDFFRQHPRLVQSLSILAIGSSIVYGGLAMRDDFNQTGEALERQRFGFAGVPYEDAEAVQNDPNLSDDERAAAIDELIEQGVISSRLKAPAELTNQISNSLNVFVPLDMPVDFEQMAIDVQYEIAKIKRDTEPDDQNLVDFFELFHTYIMTEIEGDPAAIETALISLNEKRTELLDMKDDFDVPRYSEADLDMYTND